MATPPNPTLLPDGFPPLTMSAKTARASIDLAALDSAFGGAANPVVAKARAFLAELSPETACDLFLWYVRSRQFAIPELPARAASGQCRSMAVKRLALTALTRRVVGGQP